VAKGILLSVVIAMILIPVLVARDPNPFRGFRKLLIYTFVFNLMYWLAVRFVYPRLL